MQNKGVEFTLDVIPYDSRDISHGNIGGNVTTITMRSPNFTR
jgi:hypothetical protein